MKASVELEPEGALLDQLKREFSMSEALVAGCVVLLALALLRNQGRLANKGALSSATTYASDVF